MKVRDYTESGGVVLEFTRKESRILERFLDKLPEINDFSAKTVTAITLRDLYIRLVDSLYE